MLGSRRGTLFAAVKPTKQLSSHSTSFTEEKSLLTESKKLDLQDEFQAKRDQFIFRKMKQYILLYI